MHQLPPTQGMKKFQGIFTRLIHKKDKEQNISPESVGCSAECSEKELVYVDNVATQVEAVSSPGHNTSRLRWSHRRSSYLRVCRSRTFPTGGLQRGSERNDAALRPSSPEAPQDGATGTHRAPIFSNAQPPRSPRPPFEESVRTLTRRTPGSEDATSVGNEIGYPVVGPATVRPGLGLSGTLFHQDIVMYSHDVFTNTPHTQENFGSPAATLIQTYPEAQDIPPTAPPDETAQEEDAVDSSHVSTESQTAPRLPSVPLLLLPQLPMTSHVESVISVGDDDIEQREEPSVSVAPASSSTPADTEAPAERNKSPVPSESTTPALEDAAPQAEASPSPTPTGQLRVPQSPDLPGNPSSIHFPAQIRRNRSSTTHSNTPNRRMTVTSDHIASIETTFCSSAKLMRSVNSPVGIVHTTCDGTHYDALDESFTCQFSGQQRQDETSSDLPIEIMIHSLDCPGNCETLSRLEDPPKETEDGLPHLSPSSVKSLRDGCRDALIVPCSDRDAQKLALNVMTCVSWSDLPNNLAVTDARGSPVENARVRIIPYDTKSTGTDDPKVRHDDEQDARKRSLRRSDSLDTVQKNRVDGVTVLRQLTLNDEDMGACSVPVDSPPLFSRRDAVTNLEISGLLLSSISAIQTTVSVPITIPVIQPVSPQQKVDCSTQSVSLDMFAMGQLKEDRAEFGTNPPTPPLLDYRSNRDSDDMDPWRDSPSDQYYQFNIKTEPALSPTMVSQACGPDYVCSSHSAEASTSMLNCASSGWDLLRAKNIANYQHFYRGAESLAFCPDCASKRGRYSKSKDHQVINPADACAALPTRPSLNKPLLVLNMSDTGISADLGTKVEDGGFAKSIDMQNHLFVRTPSGTSVASSVYIASDVKPAVINKGQALPHQSASSASQSRQTPANGPCALATGAIPKRETGARPKLGVRGEPLGVRKRTLVVNDDSSSRDRSSMDEAPNIGTRGHRVINDRSRGRVRNQLTTRKYHYGVKPEPHRSPQKWARRLDSPVVKKRSIDSRGSAKRPGSSGHKGDELRSIWINPETERSLPSSNSTIDINVEFSQTIVAPDRKSPSPNPTHKCRSCRSPRPPAFPRSKRPSNAHSEAEPNLSLFECVVCKDYLKPPIRQCNEGHGVCKNCIGQGDSCPLCHTSMQSEPNKVMDTLVRTITFPCKNSKAGCRETYWIEEHTQHEARCLYRPRPCPYATRSKINCTWQGVRSAIRSHMKKSHGHSGMVHPLKMFFSVETFDARLWENRSYDVEVLFVESEIFELHKVYDARKSCLWGLLRHILAKDMPKFCYAIRFQPQNLRTSVSFNNEAIGGAEELDEAFSKGKRFKFHLDSFTTEPLESFSVQLKVTPKSNAMFHNYL